MRFFPAALVLLLADSGQKKSWLQMFRVGNFIKIRFFLEPWIWRICLGFGRSRSRSRSVFRSRSRSAIQIQAFKKPLIKATPTNLGSGGSASISADPDPDPTKSRSKALRLLSLLIGPTKIEPIFGTDRKPWMRALERCWFRYQPSIVDDVIEMLKQSR